jgi:hypothetical protein
VVEAPSEVTKLRPPTAKPDQQQTLAIPAGVCRLGATLQATGEKPTYYDETLGAIAAVLNYAKAVQDSPDRGKAAASRASTLFDEGRTRSAPCNVLPQACRSQSTTRLESLPIRLPKC